MDYLSRRKILQTFVDAGTEEATMKAENYKVCIKVNEADNNWLTYYHNQWCDGTNNTHEDNKHESLGYKYTSDDDWYYEFNNEDGYWYVVVDKEGK